MKPKYDLFRILPSLFLMVVFHHGSLCGQVSEGKSRISFMRIAKTSDVLHTNDSTYFLMDRSPLEKFPNYKKLYDGYGLKTFKYNQIRVAYGEAIPPDGATNYSIVWYLNDSLLYLSDIDFFVVFDEIEDIFPNNEQYKLMEKLTGVKFDTKYENHTHYTYKEYKNDRSVRSKLFNPFGAMPAIWFSDTIIVKQAALYRTDLDKWDKEPCRELIFKNGKLISERIKEETD